MAKILVQLDRERPIAYSNRALYRLQSLPRPPTLEDFGNASKAYAALLAWVWACLEEKPEPFASPEDLAEYITPDSAGDVMALLVKALGGELDQKKSNGMKLSPSAVLS